MSYALVVAYDNVNLGKKGKVLKTFKTHAEAEAALKKRSKALQSFIKIKEV